MFNLFNKEKKTSVNTYRDLITRLQIVYYSDDKIESLYRPESIHALVNVHYSTIEELIDMMYMDDRKSITSLYATNLYNYLKNVDADRFKLLLGKAIDKLQITEKVNDKYIYDLNEILDIVELVD